jgi:hypothetical protein
MGVSPLRNPLYQTTLKKKLKGHHVLNHLLDQRGDMRLYIGVGRALF